MKKILTIILALVMLFTFNSIAFAKEAKNKPNISDFLDLPIDIEWHTVDEVSASLRISGGRAYMTASISTYDADSVRILAYLQRYSNGTWTTIRSWSNDYASSSGVWVVNRYVSSGYDYRLIVYYYAYENGSMVEATTMIRYDSN